MQTIKAGGGEGIRTLDTLLTYTRFPSVRLKPLGHPSIDESNESIFLTSREPTKPNTRPQIILRKIKLFYMELICGYLQLILAVIIEV